MDNAYFVSASEQILNKRKLGYDKDKDGGQNNNEVLTVMASANTPCLSTSTAIPH